MHDFCGGVDADVSGPSDDNHLGYISAHEEYSQNGGIGRIKHPVKRGTRLGSP